MSESDTAYTVASDNDEVEQTTGAVLGLDVGTFQCRVGVWKEGKVQLLQNPRGVTMMPCHVFFNGDSPSTAILDGPSDPRHDENLLSGAAVFNIKRLIGRLDTDEAVHRSKVLPFMINTLDIGVRPFIAALTNNVWRSATPEEAMAILLVELKAMAQASLRRPVHSVVITMPVCFSRFQQTRVERACAIAGLHVLRLMPEPTAVALLYAQQQLSSSSQGMGSGMERLALIFNMGAGFCDVAVTATAGGVSQIKALAGEAVGGEDMLQNMMRHLAPDLDPLVRDKNTVGALARLRCSAQKAMHALSRQPTAAVDGMNVSLTREDFETANAEVFKRVEAMVGRCLRDAQIDVESIADVVMVGGCSNIPRIRSLVAGMCGNAKCYDGMKALEAAVCGAALEGAIASGISHPDLELLTIQVTPLSLGIRVGESEFVPIINRNATIPARRDALFTTSYDNQSEAAIIVYEGEGRGVGENHVLGFFKLCGIPPCPKGVPVIDVCMDVDASNVLRVLAGITMPGSKVPVVPFVEVRMPTVDDGQGWCIEALQSKYGSSLDISLLPRQSPQ